MTIRTTKPAINLREELASLRKPTGVAGEAMLRAETPQEQFNLIGAGRRNLIINGGIQISQRGTYSSATASSHNGYTVDRWKTATVGVNATVQKQTATLPNGWEATSTKITASTTASSGSYIGQNQTIEDGQRILRSGKTWTVSAWVKTNRNDVVVRLGGVKNVGEAAVGDGNWHYYSTTFDYTTAGSGGQGISFLTYDNGATSVTTGDYIEFTQFQLELGKVATPFEHRSYGEELAAAQRYYWRSAYASYTFLGSGLITNATLGLVPIFFSQRMRTAPTCSASGSFGLLQTNTLAASLSFSEASQQSVRANATVSGATAGRACLLRTENSTAAYIDADAEL